MLVASRKALFVIIWVLSALILIGCDSGAQIDSNGSDNLESGTEATDFFDEHFSDRPEYAHYSAHDMDANRRDALDSNGEPILGAALPDSFRNWESPHVHPLDLTPDNNTLLAVNTADAKLEVFRISGSTPISIDAIPVGLDPVSVRARSNAEAWVVNHVSDTISIVDLNSGVVTHTLQTDDEPADVIFAGNPERAFVTASQVNTVMVFDPANLNADPQVIEIAGEDPRSLAVSTDGSTVYAAIFESGNASTIVRGGRLRNDYLGVESPLGPYGGQNPPPNAGNGFSPAINSALPTPPRVSMIVKKDANGSWMDDNNGDWSDLVSGDNAAESGRIVGWDLPDNDVAIIDANSLDVTYQSGLMNMVMGISVNPRNNRVVVVGTDAKNEVRFEPNLKSHFVTSNFAEFAAQGGDANLRDLNSHLTADITYLAPAQRQRSIGDPRSITWGPSGVAGYVTAMGSNSVLRINANGTRRTDMPVPVGHGPTASIVHVPSTRLFVLNRFGASISVVNFNTATEEQRVPFSFDPTPDFVNEGRRLLYDTQAFSGLGQVSCASCHVDARYDRLAWDLGNPAGNMEFVEEFPFHPMKGPMRTTSLIGVVGSPVLHFRGDKETLPDFSPTYTNLQGMLVEPTPDEMNQLESFIDTIQTPPNPFRNLDNTMPTMLLIPGPENRVGNPHNPSNNCSRCHDPDLNGRGDIQTGGNNSPGQQTTTAPSLRSMYEILGMYSNRTDSTAGFAFIADGANDTQAGNTLRNNNSLALMMAFNGDASNDTHAAVGTQVTFNGSESAEDTSILSQLVTLAESEQIGLVAHGLHSVEQARRGYTYLAATNSFQTMTANETVSLESLQAGASNDFPITFTAVPIGSEFRIGVDRNDDGIFDLDESDTNTGETANVITNGDFTSNLAGWLSCGGQSVISAGSATLSANGCIYQEFAAIPQATYSVSCDASVTGGYASIQLAASDARYVSLATDLTPVTGSNAAPVSAMVTAPDLTAQAVLTLYAEEQGSFDNCVVTVDGDGIVPVVFPNDQITNDLLINADFDNSLSGWDSCGGQQASVADGLNGGSAVNLSAGGCLYQEFSIRPGTQYNLQCIAKSTQDFSNIALATFDSSFNELQSQNTALLKFGEYHNSTAGLTSAGNAVIGVVTLYADTDATFDSCAVEEIADPFIPVSGANDLLTNGDFANTNNGWLSCGGGNSIGALGTDNSAAMVLENGGCVYQEFNATAGKTYELICRASSPSYASVSLSYSDVNFTPLAKSEAPVLSAVISSVFTAQTAPTNTARAAVTLYADESAVFDNCAVVER